MKKVSKKRIRDFQKKVDDSISNRVIVLACIIIAMFGILAIRLIYLQGFAHTSYLEKKDDYTSIKQYTSAPRGQIYDCRGNIIAKTVVSHNIVYTSPNNLTTKDYLMYADRVGTVFDITLEDFSSQDLKEAYLVYCGMLDSTDPKYNGLNLLSESDKKAYLDGSWGNETQSKLYALQMKALANTDVTKELDPKDLKTYAIYNRMLANQASGQQSVILEDVSDTDVAYLVEHKTEFPGFDVDFGGWKREYPYGEHLSDVIGTVSTSTEGLPLELKDYYQSQGYQLNSQVGKSGLELQYNTLLAGTEEITKITYDSNGLAVKEVLQEAKKGYDLYISVDMDLQVPMDDTLKAVLQQYGGTEKRENFHSLYMCMMNPNDGSMLALSGYQQDPETRQLTYFASGNYRSNVNPGSCIKGATVYMGQSEGVVNEGEYILDAVMNIGGQEFASFKDHGVINDVDALAVSSNVYMFNIAIRLGGGQYVEGEPLTIADPQATLNNMSGYYSMFGLGNLTGIDAPGEVDAYMGTSSLPGMLLNYSIGQYDMYTPLQLLEYVSVVANGGKLYQPRFYEYAKEVNSEEFMDVNEPKVKSTLPEENESHLQRVQMGMTACVAEGNCYLDEMDVQMAAKTGTAEVGEWTTANLLGFGPVGDPTVAFACSAPTSSINSSNLAENICGLNVVKPVLNKYFELYPTDAE